MPLKVRSTQSESGNSSLEDLNPLKTHISFENMGNRPRLSITEKFWERFLLNNFQTTQKVYLGKY